MNNKEIMVSKCKLMVVLIIMIVTTRSHYFLEIDFYGGYIKGEEEISINFNGRGCRFCSGGWEESHQYLKIVLNLIIESVRGWLPS